MAQEDALFERLRNAPELRLARAAEVLAARAKLNGILLALTLAGIAFSCALTALLLWRLTASLTQPRHAAAAINVNVHPVDGPVAGGPHYGALEFHEWVGRPFPDELPAKCTLSQFTGDRQMVEYLAALREPQRAVLFVIGSHDNRPLKPTFARKVGSNAQLAHLRAKCIIDALRTQIPEEAPVRILDASIGATSLERTEAARSEDRRPKIVAAVWTAAPVAAAEGRK